jgi:hypothetical protein
MVRHRQVRRHHRNLVTILMPSTAVDLDLMPGVAQLEHLAPAVLPTR